jgi:hypothetical protein
VTQLFGARLYEALLLILQRRGPKALARSSLERSMKKLALSAETLGPENLEVLVERTMEGFRVFLDDEERQALWIELHDFMQDDK